MKRGGALLWGGGRDRVENGITRGCLKGGQQESFLEHGDANDFFQKEERDKNEKGEASVFRKRSCAEVLAGRRKGAHRWFEQKLDANRKKVTKAGTAKRGACSLQK